MKSRTYNAKRSIVTGIINRIVLILMPFVVRTMIIHSLGMEYLGLDSLFVSVLQVLNLSELGLSNAIVYCMYKPVANDDKPQICALYNFLKKIYRIIGLCILVIGILLLPFLSFLVKGESPAGVNIYLLYIIYLMNTVISYFLFAYKNVLLNAYQRLDIYNNILTVSKLGMYVIQLICLYLFSDYYLYIIILPFSTLTNNLLVHYYVKKLFPKIKAVGKLTISDIQEIKKQVSGLIVSKVCNISRNSFDSIIISSYMGLTVTAMYNNYFYILNAVFSMLIVFSGNIIPSIGNSIVTSSKEKNYSDFKKFNFIFMWIVGVATVCLLNLYQPFMEIWVGKKNELSNVSVGLFVIYFWVLSMGNIRSSYVNAVGLWWQYIRVTILEVVLNLILNILLGKLWGVNGIILATIVTIVFINGLCGAKILFEQYFSKLLYWEHYRNTIFYFLVTSLACFLSLIIVKLIPLFGIAKIGINLIISVLVTNIVFLTIYCSTSMFKLAKEWLVFQVKKGR